MDKDTKDILEAVNFIKERMVTKDDLQEFATKDDIRTIVEEIVEEKVQPIYASLAEIHRRLDALEEHYANLKGVTKEIDDIRAEVRAIQKHIGIEGKIAA